MVQDQKLLSKVGSMSTSRGLGKSANNGSVDNFVLHRKWNIPEVVFN